MPSPQLASVTHSFGGAHCEHPLRAVGLKPSRQFDAAWLSHALQVPCVHQLPLVQSLSAPQWLPTGKRIIGGPPRPPCIPNIPACPAITAGAPALAPIPPFSVTS